MAIGNMKELIEGFFSSDNASDGNGSFKIYNEASLQYELGIYLKSKLGTDYRVDFERNCKRYPVTDIVGRDMGEVRKKKMKEEIDLFIYSDNTEKYAIEVKYPRNGAYRDEYRAFTDDILFMGRIADLQDVQKTYCLTVTSDSAYSEHVEHRVGRRIAEENWPLYKLYRTRPENGDYNGKARDYAKNTALNYQHKHNKFSDNVMASLTENNNQGIIWKKAVDANENKIFQKDGYEDADPLQVYYYLIEIDGTKSNVNTSNE